MSFKRKSVILSKIVLFVLVSLTTVWAAGEIDPTFNAAAYANPGTSEDILIKAQPDGKLLVFGSFFVVNDVPATGFVRINTDGSLDTTFNPQCIGGIGAIAFQSNGKMLVGCSSALPDTPDMVRLNPDGSIDNSFNPNIQFPFGITNVIDVQPDNSFFAGFVSKFDANGFPLPEFQYQSGVNSISDYAGQPDGRLYVVGNNSTTPRLVRHNANGTPDAGFPSITANGFLTDVEIQPDGKVLIAGNFSAVNGQTRRGIARINADGTIDSGFSTGSVSINAFDLELLPDGKILAGGSGSLRKFNADGTLDTSFSYTPPTGNVLILNVEIFPNGRIAISGDGILPSQGSGWSGLVVMLNPDGTRIPGFYIMKAGQARVRKIAVQSDGKIYIAGEFPIVNGEERRSLARLNPNGTLDTTFVPFFASPSPGTTHRIHQVLVQLDGKILVSFSNSLVVVRLNSNGTRDTSFNTPLPSSSIVYDLALQADGKILFVGEVDFSGGTPLFGRLNSNGSLDSSFNPPLPNSRIHRILLQPDGKSIICGEFTQIGTANRGRIARYNTDGTLDQTFSPAGGANGNVYDIDLQSDGKIVLGGTFGSLNGSMERDKIGRLNADGSLDTSFAQTVNTTVQTVKVQPDGKVLIGGLFANVGGIQREKLARLNANGSLDLTFNASANALVFDINLQADGKILVAGDFITVNNITKLALARLNNSAPPRKLFDYDGDGKDDVSVFRPSENKWFIYRSSDGQIIQQVFAISGDVPVPSDYDGDGKTEIAIYRPSSADWWSLSTANGNQVSTHWGEPGVIALPSDFDGDGKSDYIFFLPANSTWYRYGSSVGASYVTFGLSGDKPVTGDFDGDGKSDVAIYRPSTGDWWYAASSAGGQHRAVHWGISTDIPAPADYDSDGTTDFAVYRPSTGTWYIINSSNGSFTIMNFGLAEDKPVPADYDGDGRADIAVFRPSTGIWYLMRSTAGFMAQQFGVSTDIPTENAFVP